jgi:hypothetical protein
MLQAARKFLKDRSPDWLNTEIESLAVTLRERDFFKNLFPPNVSIKPVLDFRLRTRN